MNKFKINIDVIGEAGSGKSSIAAILLETLKSQGFDAELDFTSEINDYGSESRFFETINNNRDEREKALKERMEITIKQTQASRNSLL